MKKLLSSAASGVVLVLAAILTPLEHPLTSFAAAPTLPGFRQIDLDGDGKPDEAIIECTCATSRDLIQVFDGGDDMRSSADWMEGTDLMNDTWVFDIGMRDEANLIIQFRSDSGEQVAHFFDDVDGDGSVAYHVEGKQVVIDESAYWTLEVSARPGWYMENGQTNLNIHVLLDKPFPEGFEFIDEDFARQYMPHDGRPDVEFEMVDPDNDGVAEYFLSRLLSAVPEEFEVGKSRLWFNVGRKPSQRPDSALFWPFLDLQPITAAEENSLRFFDLLPSVRVDWQASSIRGFVLPGYPVEAGYWLNSQSSIKDGQVNDISYEAPHAWYDLVGNQDAIPELNIRLFMPNGQSRQEIRYSWNQVNSGQLVWDYKLGLMGNNPIEEIVDFDNFSLRMIPYEKLPFWVTQHEWELATFVAREGLPRESSEGIYAWTPWSGADPISPDNPSKEAFDAALSYVTGNNIEPPDQFFNDIWEGFRGEYNFSRPSRPILYFSPVDRRLHLKGAEHGLLNLGNGHYITYDNKDGDDYIDQWSWVEAGETRHQLFATKAYLLFSGENEVLLKKVDTANSLFETLPPRSHTEWLGLGQMLEQHSRENAPDDLKGMALQFGAPETHIEGATLQDFRSTQEGFRFVLKLLPGFWVSGPEAHNWNGLPPGMFVVSYTDSVRIEPLTPAAISISLVDTEHTQLETSAIQVSIRNDGLEDLPVATLELLAITPDGTTTVVVTQTVQLLAQEPVTASLLWAPSTAGQWTLTPMILQPDGQIITGNAKQIHVRQSQAADFSSLIPLTAPDILIPFLVTGLIAFAGIGSLAFYNSWKRSLSKEK